MKSLSRSADADAGASADTDAAEPDEPIRLPAGYRAAEVSRGDELSEANRLYVRVFGYEDPAFSINPRLLTAILSNGGSSVAVFGPTGAMVGYAYGFAGRDAAGHDYHFSQAAVVDPSAQGKGIGRALKRMQANVARRRGHREMRWTFDPVRARNAHFNLDTLGAIGIDCFPDYYGVPDSDRMLVSWDIAGGRSRPLHAQRLRPAPPALTAGDWGRATDPDAADARWIAIPAQFDRLEASPDRLRRLRTDIVERLRETLAADCRLVSCVRLSDGTAAYLAIPELARSRA